MGCFWGEKAGKTEDRDLCLTGEVESAENCRNKKGEGGEKVLRGKVRRASATEKPIRKKKKTSESKKQPRYVRMPQGEPS